ncbi:MAG: SIR2 family protein [Chloroflexota bacterium]|nr:SIR2 family protein [Chloroflexota bacterium]
MLGPVISPQMSPADRAVCEQSLAALRYLVTDARRPPIFFAGAGVSIGSGIPATADLLAGLVRSALARSVGSGIDTGLFSSSLGHVRERAGFETTLNDLRLVSTAAVTEFFALLAAFEGRHCEPQAAHHFLARWIVDGGSVMTTNYDRLIERARPTGAPTFPVRYRDSPGASDFASWRRDLDAGCLFKIHGSLDDPASCLGAMADVGTRLRGDRAALLATLGGERPACVIGWRGADPDIPSVLANHLRGARHPVIWVHNERSYAKPRALRSCIEALPASFADIPGILHLVTSAERLFVQMAAWCGWDLPASPTPHPAVVDFDRAVRLATPTGSARFVGQTFRRAAQNREIEDIDVAHRLFRVAHDVATTPTERWAALSEQSHTWWLQGNRGRALRVLKQAGAHVRWIDDPDARVTHAYGMLLQTQSLQKTRPWLFFATPSRLAAYARSIEALEGSADGHAGTESSVALHRALFHCFEGKRRLLVAHWFGPLSRVAAAWILQPFHRACALVEDAGAIHVHSQIDIYAARALALARLGRCDAAWDDVRLLERLCRNLADQGVEAHFLEHRLPELERLCAPTRGTR